MIAGWPRVRQLPVVLPPLVDELLSSWVSRHASFYGVGGGQLLRHCSLEARSLRELDLSLTSHDQRRLAYVFRCDTGAIRRMTQSRGRRHPTGLIATIRPMQVCQRCVTRHQAAPVTSGVRLRSWMEGWRIRCPVCGAALEDARPLDMLRRVDAVHPLLVEVAEHARRGEAMLTRATRLGRAGRPVVALMRNLLLTRARSPQETFAAGEVPRLLDAVVPGFDRFLYQSHPGFRRPGTLLLPISVRIPVLAGVALVTRRPKVWAEALLGAAAETARPALAACFRDLMAA